MASNAKTSFINRYRASMATLLQTMNELNDLQREFLFSGFASGPNAMVDADFIDGSTSGGPVYPGTDNSDLKAQDLIDAAGAVTSTENLLTANSNALYGKLYKVKRQQ